MFSKKLLFKQGVAAAPLTYDVYGWGVTLGSTFGYRSDVVALAGNFPPTPVLTTTTPFNRAETERYGTLYLDVSGYLWGSGVINHAATTSSQSWSAVSSGMASFAIRNDGALFGWGQNSSGALGTPLGTGFNRSSPVQLSAAGTSWNMVRPGKAFTGSDTPPVRAIRSNSTLWGWGLNTSGQLGDGTVISRSSPVQISSSSWTTVTSTEQYALAIRSDGALFAWGIGGTGALASDNNTLMTTSWTQLEVGISSIHGIRADGALFAWGRNVSGALGTNDVVSRTSPVQIGTSSWTSLSVGAGFVLAIRADGTLWGWGEGGNQLGIYTPFHRSSPVQISSQSWSSVSAGLNHAFAIRTNGTLWGWGQNTNGELGTGNALHRSSPVQLGTSSWTKVSAGANFTLAIRNDSTLWAWGLNNNGQLGETTGPTYTWSKISLTSQYGDDRAMAIRSDGTLWVWGNNNVTQYGFGSVARSSPVQVGTSSWTQLATGASCTAAIRTDGALFTWGENSSGQLGLNSGAGASGQAPAQVGTDSWVQVSVQSSTMFAIRSDGALFGWGHNAAGQLGLDDTVHRSSPVQIGTSSWTFVFAGFAQTAAIRSDGALFTWGNGVGGVLGGNSVVHRSSPVQIGTSSWSVVSIQESVAAAIRSDGTLWGWGQNVPTWPSLSTRSSPVQVAAGSWTAVSCGYGGNHMLAIRNDGTLWGGGSDPTVGILGEGFVRNLVWSQIGLRSWTQISLGSNVGFGITDDNLLWAWGNNNTGNLGVGDRLVHRSSPTLVGPAGTTISRSSPVQISTESWTAIAAGTSFSLAVRSNGTLFAWGINNTGQLGQTPDYEWPWKRIAIGNNFNAAIRADDTLWVWGNTNSVGQFGNNTAVSSTSPIQIGTSSWTAITCGVDRMFAIRSDGALFAWGRNDTGELGLNDRVHRSSPVQVGTSSWTSVASGGDATYAIRSDGGLFAWGSNQFGTVGDNIVGVTNSRSSPVQIGTSSWTFVSGGLRHAYAIRSDGGLFVWGTNTQGELGLNDRVHRSSPVQVGTSSWTSVAAGWASGVGGFAAALRYDNTLWMWGDNTSGQLGQFNFIHRSSPVQVGLRSWTDVKTAQNQVYALRSDKTIWAWGLGSTSQPLGNSVNVGASSPSQVTASRGAAVGPNVPLFKLLPYTTNPQCQTMMALSEQNTLFVWGNQHGLGLGGVQYNAVPIIGQFRGPSAGVSSRSSPTQVGILNSWTQVHAAGGGLAPVAYAMRSDGSIWSWGSNNGYALQDMITFSTSTSRSIPLQIGSQSWTQINATKYAQVSTVLAIASNGYGYIGGFGGTTGAELFNYGGPNASTIAGDSLKPIGMVLNLISPNQIGTSSWTSVAASRVHAAAIRSDGALFTWGSDLNNSFNTLYTPDSGALGYNEQNGTRSPQQVGTSSWSQVAVGFHFTAAIRSDGRLFTWGNNREGTLGDNTTDYRSSPVQVGTSSWTAIAAGTSYMTAIRSDGGLFAWGDNSDGQLGLNDVVHRSSPVQIGTSSWTQIDITYRSTFARRSDGALFAWGNNGAGLLGIGDNLHRSSPVQIGGSSTFYQLFDSPVQIGTSTYAEITRGFDSNAGIRSDGTLWTWGLNNVGQLGVGDIAHRSSTTQVGAGQWAKVYAGANHMLAISSTGSLWGWGDFTGGKIGEQKNTTFSWSQLSLSSEHALAIRSDGALFAWGSSPNAFGKLGLNTGTDQRSSPVQVGTSSWISVEAGDDQSLAIRSDGALFAWGGNTNGQLGQNDRVHRSSPVQVGTSSWTQISTEGNVCAAIRSDGALFVWGVNGFGQHGQADVVNRSSPVQVGTSSWTAVSVASVRTTAIRSDGALFAWGLNSAGQLGQNDLVHRSSPVQIGTSSWSNVSAGANHILAVRSNGTMWAWGLNSAGQLGILADSNIVSWTVVSGSRSSPGSTFHAIRSDGALFAWGENAYGQLGDGTTLNRSSPVQIGTSSWIAVSSDGFFGWVLAIRSDGGLFAWGNGANGKLGDNTGVSKSSPVQIGTSSWIAVAADSGATSFAIRQDGGLFSWGGGFGGSLGDSTLAGNAHRSSPVQIGTSSWTAISSRAYGAFAIRSDGGLFGWGFQGAALGNPLVAYSSPIQIGTSSWTSVATSVDTIHAIRSDGTLWGWGENSYGEVGNGTTTVYSSPVQIGTSSWTSVTSRFNVTIAIKSDGTLWSWGRGDSAAGQSTAVPSLGDETTAHRSSPVQIGLGDSWTGVPTIGRQAIAVIKNNGSLWVWGNDNGYGSLGQNQLVSHSSPVQIGPNTPIAPGAGVGRSSPVQIGIGYSWNSVAAGGSHSVALRADGKLFAWGLSASPSTGQVGDNTIISKSSPVQIGALSWSIVRAGFSSSGAVRSDSQLYVWGGGVTIGDETVNHRSSPVVVGLIYPQVHRSSPVLVSSSSWSVISAGISHSAAIRTDGALFMWGINTSGQLGQSDRVHRSSPIQVGTSSWTAVSVGSDHTIAIRQDGTMWAWGLGNVGQLGFNTTVAVGNLDGAPMSWSMVASRRGYGGNHVLAIRSDGGLFAWGLNSTGQLGLNDLVHRSIPTQIGTSSWTMVAINTGVAAAGTSAAIRSDGRLFMWGYNALGAIGDGTTIGRSSPVQVGTSSWTSVSVGGATYAIRSDGRLFAWGYNQQGQLGQGNDFVHRSSPIQIGTSSWTAVSAGVERWGGSQGLAETAMAIRSDNTVWVWGVGRYFLTPISLGLATDPQTSSASSPVQITSLPSTYSWTQVMSDGQRHFALNSNGDLYGWGIQPLAGLDLFVNLFNMPDLQPQSWSMVAVGSQHSLGIRSDGSLWAWGINTSGIIGNNNRTTQRSMVQIGTSSWIAVAASGNYSAYAIRSDGALFAWGWNIYGQLGLNDRVDRSSPVQIGTSSWTKVAGGSVSVHAIRSDGALFAWGYNDFGVLGLNDGVHRSSPVQVGTSSWSQIAGGVAGSFQTYAIRSDGALFAWGQNDNGQVGDNTITNRSSPVQISTSSWTIVHGGFKHGGAIRSDNTVWVWGRNAEGQLGQNDRVHRSSPVQVFALGHSTFSTIAGGAVSTPGWFGITTNNVLVYWGGGYGGRYWVSQTDQLTPVAIVNTAFPATSAFREGNDISSFSVSNHGEHMGAISKNGYLSMWGGPNDFGQKGRPDFENYALDIGTGPQRVGQIQIKVSPDNAGLVATGVRYFSAWGGSSTLKSALSVLKTDSTYAVIGTGGIPSTNGSVVNQARSSLVTMSSTKWKSMPEDGLFGIDSSNMLYVWGDQLVSSGTQGTNTIFGAGTSSPVLVVPFNPAGNTFPRSSPVQIGLGRSWVAVSAGASFNVAIDTGRGLWVWGGPTVHTMSSSLTNTGIPTRVGTASSWIFVDSSLHAADLGTAFALLKNP